MFMRRVFYLAPYLAIIATAPALAMERPHDERQDDGGDIVVTVQLRQQPIRDVPIALSVLQAQDLTRLGLDEFDSLSRLVPGFAVQNQSPNNPGFVMRGITSDSGAAFEEPRVSVFQDGVSISRSRGAYIALFDIARVEVAKGPQSTLYGRGALIGAVNVIQNKADPAAFALSGSASLGNYNARTWDAMANVPLGQGIAIRLAGHVQTRDGYIGDLLGGAALNSTDTKALRSAFHVDRDGFDLDVTGNYQQDRPTGTSFKSIAFRPTDPITGFVLGDAGRNSAAALAASAGFPDGDRLGVRRKIWGVTAIANLTLSDNFKLTSTTAYRKFHAVEIFDVDGLSLPLLTAAEDTRGKQASQELRLTYEHGPLTAIIGAGYFHEDGADRNAAQFDERITLAQLAGALNGGGAMPMRPFSDPAPLALFGNTAFTSRLLQGAAFAKGYLLDTQRALAIAANLKADHLETATNYARTNAVDVFGDVTVKLSERFELGAGLRYTHDDKASQYRAAVLNGRSILGGFIGALSQSGPVRETLLTALAAPYAATIPLSPQYPVPMFGLANQPSANNGQIDSAGHKNGGFSWRLTARYQPANDASIYASYAHGRRPEVLAASGPDRPFGASNLDVLPSETVESYEWGAKALLANRRLRLNAAMFHYIYSNFQTTAQQGTQLIIINAGRAENDGVEAEIQWIPNDFITLSTTYAYTHGRFKNGLRRGNRFRLSPDHAASFSAYLAHPLATGRITFTPSLTWQSKVFFDDDNDRSALQQPPATLVPDNVANEFQRGYALINMRLGYEAPRHHWRVEAFINNVFNKQYIKDAGNIGDALGLPTFIAAPPRFYGVTTSFRWGGE